MDPETAVIVLAVITTVGGIVWLAGLRFLVTSPRSARAGEQPTPEEAGPAGEGPEGWISGGTEVEGDRGTLAARAAAILARGHVLTFGPVKILEKADDRIRFERLEAGMANRPANQWFRRGELRFTPLGSGHTRVEWAVEPVDMRWLLWLGGLFQVLGLIALVVGCWAIATFVVSSPELAVRWQTVQMVQAVHFLWPPFLFGALYRRGKRAVSAQFEALAHNLPYCEG
jgi:hypothetical protein